MSAILIQSQSEENLKLIKEFAAKLGETATPIDADQLEDIALGLIMKKEKTSKKESRDSTMKKHGVA